MAKESAAERNARFVAERQDREGRARTQFDEAKDTFTRYPSNTTFIAFAAAAATLVALGVAFKP